MFIYINNFYIYICVTERELPSGEFINKRF